MALLKMINHMLARRPNIGKNANFNIPAGNNKTMRIGGIMKLRKSYNF